MGVKFKTCLRWRRGMEEYFEVRRELKHGYVMSPWLFIISFGKVVR